jgi:hypothetical protein
MRTTVAIADALLESAKQHAAERGVTLSELVEEGLGMVLSATSKTKTARPFVLKTVGSVSSRPFPTPQEIAEVLEAEDAAIFRK